MRSSFSSVTSSSRTSTLGGTEMRRQSISGQPRSRPAALCEFALIRQYLCADGQQREAAEATLRAAESAALRACEAPPLYWRDDEYRNTTRKSILTRLLLSLEREAARSYCIPLMAHMAEPSTSTSTSTSSDAARARASRQDRCRCTRHPGTRIIRQIGYGMVATVLLTLPRGR